MSHVAFGTLPAVSMESVMSDTWSVIRYIWTGHTLLQKVLMEQNRKLIRLAYLCKLFTQENPLAGHNVRHFVNHKPTFDLAEFCA